MKKYNLSVIMKRTWALVKEAGMTLSDGLKKAWAEVKNMKKQFENYARVTVDGYTLSFKRWENYGKKRIYINEVKGQDGQREQSTGAFIDIESKELNKGTGYKIFNDVVAEFINAYEF